MHISVKVARFVTAHVAAHGAGVITAYAIGVLIPPVKSLPVLQRAAVYTGAFFVGMIIKDAVRDKVYDLVDNTQQAYDTIKAKLREEEGTS